jgi:hypothetical protein
VADLTDIKPAGVELRFVGDPGGGYEIQLANHDELSDEAIAALLQEALTMLSVRSVDTPASRAMGMW